MTTRTRKVVTAISESGQAVSEIHTETLIGDRWFPNDPLPLDSLSEWAATFNAAIESERNSLASQLTSIQSQLEQVTAERNQLLQNLAALELQLNPPKNPRHIAPYDFLSLLTGEEIYAMQTSVDPVVIVGRTKLQTIITYVDLDNQETIGLVRYLESAGLLTAGRADEILSGEKPT